MQRPSTTLSQPSPTRRRWSAVSAGNFTPTEIGASVFLLERWVETGVRPTAADLAAFGLDGTTPPPEWPQD